MRKCKICKYGDSPCDWCVHDPDGELNFEPKPDAIDSLASENERLEAENAALREQLQEPANDPLTLDELRQMDGEPVWATHFDGSGGRWGIVTIGEFGIGANVDCDTCCWFDIPNACIAYRRKPDKEG